MPEFVNVVVEATGRIESVPSDWLDNPVLGKGISLAPETTPAVEAPVVPSPPSEVQTVAGTEDDLPIVPAAREAVLAAREAAASEEVPTEANTHEEIDAFAEKAEIDLSGVKTKAEKVAVIDAHLNPAGTEPSAETPAAGEEE